jgi:hypothetical protein
MATNADVIEVARNFLRDFPRFFQYENTSGRQTQQLGHMNVSVNDLYVATVSGGTPTQLTSTQYTLIERDGVVRIDPAVDVSAADSLIVEGFYYEWLTPADLAFYSQHAIDLTFSTLPNMSIANASEAVVKVTGMATIVHALWGLLTEYARDVDVIASESVHIPASQRFRMVQSLLSQWQEEHKKHAEALNIGINRIEVFNLRRRSRTTERLVPTYQEREIGDFGPLTRIWNDPEDGTIELEEPDDELREDVYVDGPPPQGLTNSSYFPGYGGVYY